jgi:hypothetical protein
MLDFRLFRHALERMRSAIDSVETIWQSAGKRARHLAAGPLLLLAYLHSADFLATAAGLRRVPAMHERDE